MTEEQSYSPEEAGPAFAPQIPMMPSDRSFLAEVTNPAKLLVEIKQHLEGMSKDPKTGEWMSVRPPIANKVGIGTILLKIGTIVTQNTILSSLSEDDVCSFMLNTAREIRLLLAQNFERFEIQESDMTTAKNIILDPIFFALRRAMNEGERKFLSKTLSERHTEVLQRQTPKKSLLSGILNIGGV